MDGNGNVGPATVSMTVSGAAVTPTVTKSGGETKVSYKPATNFAPGATIPVDLTYGDRTVSWSFRVGDIAATTFFFEAEDFNTGGGQAPVAASTMPYQGGAFAGLSAVHDVDYFRPGDENASPMYRMDEEPSVPMDRTGDRDRGLLDIAVNYKIGWTGGGQWFNYTRTFPAGRYNVYAGLSHGDGAGTTMRARLEKVTSDPTQANQTTESLGSFTAPGTAGWGNNAIVPLRDGGGNMVALDLSGSTTLRVYPDNGDYDFVLFTAAPLEPPMFTKIMRNANGSITVEWSGGGTLQAGPTVAGPWQDVTGATSPFTFAPTEAMLFGRIKR